MRIQITSIKKINKTINTTNYESIFYLPAGIILLASSGCKKDPPENKPKNNPQVGKKWVVTTIAGNGVQAFVDGAALFASFSIPEDVVVSAGGTIYVTDLLNARIRKITPQGLVSTIAGSSAGFADGIGNSAKFNNPIGLE